MQTRKGNKKANHLDASSSGNTSDSNHSPTPPAASSDKNTRYQTRTSTRVSRKTSLGDDFYTEDDPIEADLSHDEGDDEASEDFMQDAAQHHEDDEQVIVVSRPKRSNGAAAKRKSNAQEATSIEEQDEEVVPPQPSEWSDGAGALMALASTIDVLGELPTTSTSHNAGESATEDDQVLEDDSDHAAMALPEEDDDDDEYTHHNTVTGRSKSKRESTRRRRPSYKLTATLEEPKPTGRGTKRNRQAQEEEGVTASDTSAPPSKRQKRRSTKQQPAAKVTLGKQIVPPVRNGTDSAHYEHVVPSKFSRQDLDLHILRNKLQAEPQPAPLLPSEFDLDATFLESLNTFKLANPNIEENSEITLSRIPPPETVLNSIYTSLVGAEAAATMDSASQPSFTLAPRPLPNLDKSKHRKFGRNARHVAIAYLIHYCNGRTNKDPTVNARMLKEKTHHPQSTGKSSKGSASKGPRSSTKSHPQHATSHSHPPPIAQHSLPPPMTHMQAPMMYGSVPMHTPANMPPHLAAQYNPAFMNANRGVPPRPPGASPNYKGNFPKNVAPPPGTIPVPNFPGFSYGWTRPTTFMGIPTGPIMPGMPQKRQSGGHPPTGGQSVVRGHPTPIQPGLPSGSMPARLPATTSATSLPPPPVMKLGSGMGGIQSGFPPQIIPKMPTSPKPTASPTTSKPPQGGSTT